MLDCDKTYMIKNKILPNMLCKFQMTFSEICILKIKQAVQSSGIKLLMNTVLII